MNFLAITTLCLSILICKRVNSSLNSVLENQLASYDNGVNLRNFFVDLRTVIEKIQPWFVMVVARTDEDLRSTEPLFENYSHLICVKIENCEYTQKFHRENNLVIIFIDDLSNETIYKIRTVLSTRGTFLFVFDLHQFEQSEITLFGLEIIRRGVKIPFKLAHFNKDAIGIDVYSIAFTKNCSVEIVLDLVWKVGTDLSKIKLIDSDSDMNGCSVPVGMFPALPKIILKEEKNGSLIIAGGRSGLMMQEIANKLNFKIMVKTPSAESTLLGNSLGKGVIHEISSGVVKFGIGGFRAINGLSEKLSYSTAYDMECLTWGVPRIPDHRSNNIIWAEFQWRVWVGVGLILIIVCVIEYFYGNVIGSLLGDRNRREVDFVSIVLNILAIYLGNPVVRTAIQKSSRIIFIAFTFYALVLTTGYKTSLASILVTAKFRPAVLDTKTIVKKNFTVGGSEYSLDILKDQVNISKYIPKLIERYVIIDNDSIAMERLKSDNNFAYLARRSFLTYMKRQTVEARELITFDILDGCVLKYHVVMMFRKYSPLIGHINPKILQLIESGILDHHERIYYVDDEILERRNSELYLKSYMRDRFMAIFIFYGCCISISILVFFLELLWPKITASKKQQERNVEPRHSDVIELTDL